MKYKNTYLCVVAIALAMAGNIQAQDEDPRAMFTEAREATEAQDFEKAAEILTKLNEMRPGEALIEFNLGYNLHAAGKLDKAIEFHKKATKSDDFKPTALYNLACAYSLKKDSDKAFDYLKESIEAGFRDMNQLTSDPDFNNIKKDARFDEMVELVKNDGKAPKKKLKAEDLFGSWKVNSGMRGGAKVGSDRLPIIKIDKEAFTIPSAPGADPFVMSYKLDMDAKPITVDFKIESGPVPEGKAKGIIKVGKDGEMTLCYEPMGGDRPEKFESTEENGMYLFKMKKQMKTEVKGKKTLADQIQGKWKCVKGSRAGAEVTEERMASVITIEDKINIPVGPDAAFVMSYKIDDSKSPAHIDMEIEDGPAPPGAKAVGIVKIEDGKVFLCYDSTGANRPEKFASTEEDGFFYFEMKAADK